MLFRSALDRSREGSRVSPGEPDVEKQEHHLDDAFKKDAAPEGVAVVSLGRQPGLGFRPAMFRKPHRPPIGDQPDHHAVVAAATTRLPRRRRPRASPAIAAAPRPPRRRRHPAPRGHMYTVGFFLRFFL